jgi:hypothetical protein
MKKILFAGLAIGLIAFAMNGTASTAPEAATMLVFGIGLIGLAEYSRKKRYQKK